jgi:hypothetical protein
MVYIQATAKISVQQSREEETNSPVFDTPVVKIDSLKIP